MCMVSREEDMEESMNDNLKEGLKVMVFGDLKDSWE